MQGDGNFAGPSSVTVNTDSDGRAVASLVLGPADGFNNNRVEANFQDNTGLPAVFSASGLVPGDPSATSISGNSGLHPDHGWGWRVEWAIFSGILHLGLTLNIIGLIIEPPSL